MFFSSAIWDNQVYCCQLCLGLSWLVLLCLLSDVSSLCFSVHFFFDSNLLDFNIPLLSLNVSFFNPAFFYHISHVSLLRTLHSFHRFLLFLIIISFQCLFILSGLRRLPSSLQACELRSLSLASVGFQIPSHRTTWYAKYATQIVIVM